MPYYKATLVGGVSAFDSSFVYHEGLNMHPNPDKKSMLVCPQKDRAAGICLAKTLKAAKKYVPKAIEVYLAEPGLILAEDDDKVRVAYFWRGKLLTAKELDDIVLSEMDEGERNVELQKRHGILLTGIHPPPICGEDWIIQHGRDVTWDDWNKQTMEVSSDRHKTTIFAKIKPKDLKTVLAGIR